MLPDALCFLSHRTGGALRRGLSRDAFFLHGEGGVSVRSEFSIAVLKISPVSSPTSSTVSCAAHMNAARRPRLLAASHGEPSGAGIEIFYMVRCVGAVGALNLCYKYFAPVCH